MIQQGLILVPISNTYNREPFYLKVYFPPESRTSSHPVSQTDSIIQCLYAANYKPKQEVHLLRKAMPGGHTSCRYEAVFEPEDAGVCALWHDHGQSAEEFGTTVAAGLYSCPLKLTFPYNL